jgi:hypothetical protein
MSYFFGIVGVLSGVLTLVGFVPYIRNILLKKTRPHRVTWLIYSILDVSAVIAQISAGATWSLLLTIAAAVGCITIFLLSIKHGHGSIGKADVFSFILAVVALTLSLAIDNPLLALIVILVANIAGAWLTVRKSYINPTSETKITWLLSSISSFLGLVAAHSWQLTILLFPAYLLVSNATVFVAILLGERRKI